jgi:UDPglucose--hexose-1-phosphate uridylyltransferase
MPAYIPDSKTKRYVIISPVRLNRPNAQTKAATSHLCPFCPGNEAMTPAEVLRIPNGSSWSVRVVPNKYPITDLHEVVILSTHHTADFPLLSLDQVQNVMKAFYDRYMTHQKSGNVMIFGNHGAHAGASLPHPHAQLVVIPASIPFDAIEKEAVANIIETTAFYTVYCPQFSQWPYEIWISPNRQEISFAETTEEERNSLGFLLQKCIKILRKASESPNFPFHKENKPFGYNYYISHTKHFFVRIIPRFIHRAGFELGTGLSVNTIPPAEAADYIKSLW